MAARVLAHSFGSGSERCWHCRLGQRRPDWATIAVNEVGSGEDWLLLIRFGGATEAADKRLDRRFSVLFGVFEDVRDDCSSNVGVFDAARVFGAARTFDAVLEDASSGSLAIGGIFKVDWVFEDVPDDSLSDIGVFSNASGDCLTVDGAFEAVGVGAVNTKEVFSQRCKLT